MSKNAMSYEERAAGRIEDKTHTLYICPNAWGLRREFVNTETGETRLFRCNLWSCEYCGPRKVNEWRQCIAEAQPTLHLTLTKAGQTVEEAARALTTFMQALRRGSKGRGKNRVGYREAYPVEYFAVLEEHENFEEVGFHWHILIKGVDAIPYTEVIKPLWTSARHGKAENGWIRRVEHVRAIGYVTKYLTKDIFKSRKGVRLVEREALSLSMNEEGKLIYEVRKIQEEEESRARRIRYSKGFFPQPVKELRRRLFAPHEMEEQERAQGEEGKQIEKTLQPSSWVLREVAEPFETKEAYTHLLRKKLTRVVEDQMEQGKHLSFRVVNAWTFQRHQAERGKLYT